MGIATKLASSLTWANKEDVFEAKSCLQSLGAAMGAVDKASRLMACMCHASIIFKKTDGGKTQSLKMVLKYCADQLHVKLDTLPAKRREQMALVQSGIGDVAGGSQSTTATKAPTKRAIEMTM